LANCDSPTGYGMHFPAILTNYNVMTAYILVYTDYSFSSFQFSYEDDRVGIWLCCE